MANKVKTAFANMGWMMISQIIASICAFIWTIVTAWYLGPSDYGIFGSAVSFAALFGIIIDFGLPTLLVRAISTDFESEHKYLDNAVSLKLFLSVLYILTVFFALIILGWNSKLITITLLISFENLIKSYHSLLFTSFQAHEKLKYQAITNTVINILTLIFIIIVTFTDFALTGIAIAYILANFIALIYELYALEKHTILPKLSFDFSFYKVLLKGGLPFALTGLFYTIYYSIDLVMITQFSTTYATGLYNSAYKLITVLTLFYTIYASVVFPVMSKLFKNEKDMLNFSFNKSIKYLTLVTIPISVFAMFYGYDLIGIYGAEYIEAGGVLKILIWTVCFLFINGACSLVLNASHQEYSVTKIYTIAALFNIVLNIFLIPKYSVYGASFSTVLSEILILLLELYMLRKINQLPNRHLIYDIIKICAASAILGIALYALNLNLWIAMIVSIIVYFSAIFLLRTIDQDDKLIIKQIIGK
ncbi:flippase [uncultured Methanobrevibacter sp.]|uniref:flippase n=1 Tax=uncultured Methanobrevibacter sp. TaxID=253161 RepID=UPI0025CF6594|nr:flippase [uncultured Methanobrevibacter sp.]